MYEDNRRFSWTSLFIKIIIVVIFILFTIWLLSLSMKNTTKGMSDSLNVLTDNIFKENIDRMKNVGKDYFTTERLPEKIGEVKTLTLEEMYKKNLILEVKDKNGKACSAKNSYVAIEKLETEYQMKVYLECGSEKDFIKVIMGCYNYCNTDICEKKDTKEITDQAIEYQYSKTTGGSWGPWGAWTEWSTVEVTKNNYRDVDTKIVNEQYSYDKEIKERKYTGESACIQMDGYTLISDEKGVCTYSTNTTVKENPTCPNVSGYTFSSRDGFTCSYKQNNPSKANPVCPTLDGYSAPKRDGFTCTYSKEGTAYADPTCPKVSEFDNTGRNGFTCNYTRTYYVAVGTKIVSSCNGCAKEVITVYEPRYEYTTKTAECPAGYSQSGNSCATTTVTTETKTATCPEGYAKSGNDCVKYGTTTKTATCKDGYSKSGNICVKSEAVKVTKNAVCGTGEEMSNGKCYKVTTSTVKVIGYRDVTYYRYRLRSYTGGVTDYKWSSSNNDRSLLDAGYRLTGKTRNKEVGGK